MTQRFQIALSLCLLSFSAIAFANTTCPTAVDVWSKLIKVNDQYRVNYSPTTAFKGTNEDDNKKLATIYTDFNACTSCTSFCNCTIYDEIKASTCSYDRLFMLIDSAGDTAEACKACLTNAGMLDPIVPGINIAAKNLNLTSINLTDPSPIDEIAMKPLKPIPKPLPTVIATPQLTANGNYIDLGTKSFFAKGDCAGGTIDQYCIDTDFYQTPFNTTAKKDGTAWGGTGNIEYKACQPGGGPDGKCRIKVEMYKDHLKLHNVAEILDNNHVKITYLYDNATAFTITTSSIKCHIPDDGSRKLPLDKDHNFACIIMP